MFSFSTRVFATTKKKFCCRNKMVGGKKKITCSKIKILKEKKNVYRAFNFRIINAKHQIPRPKSVACRLQLDRITDNESEN